MESNSPTLDISCVETSACCVSMTVTIPADRVASEYKKNLRELAKKAKFPGFRAGKVPVTTIEKRFGNEIVAETTEKLINATYGEAIKEKQYNVVPETARVKASEELTKDKAYTYSVDFELIPTVNLPEYKNIQVTKDEVVVTEEQIEEVIQNWLQQRSTFKESADGESAQNDMLQATYSSDADEELLENKEVAYLLKAEGTWLVLRDPEMLPGIKTALLGLKVGDKKEVELTYPEDFRHELLKGKTFKYNFEILKVHKEVVPELDEKLLEEIGVESKEILYENLRENLLNNAENQQKQNIMKQIESALLAGQDFELPPSILRKSIEAQTAHYKEQLARTRMSDEEIEKKLIEEEKDIEKMVADSIRLDLILSEIAKAENIQPSSDEIAGFINSYANMQQSTFKATFNKLKNENRLENVFSTLIDDKVRSFLLDSADITTVKKAE